MRLEPVFSELTTSKVNREAGLLESIVGFNKQQLLLQLFVAKDIYVL